MSKKKKNRKPFIGWQERAKARKAESLYVAMDRKANATADFRLNILKENLGQAVESYRKAVTDGITSPVVFLIDATDGLGKKLATAVVGERRSREMVAFIEGLEKIPTLTLVTSHAFAVKMITELECSPKMLPSFRKPCADKEFWVVVVARNANLFTKLADLN